MSIDYIAHVKKDSDSTWAAPHSLDDHLQMTAKKAKLFASKFQSEKWGEAAGLAHDAGKARVHWQRYLRLKSGYFDDEAHMEGKSGKIPHAIYGAKLAEELYGKGIGRILSYCIAGHHAGLPDWSGAEGAGRSSLEFQLAQIMDLDSIEASVTNGISSSKPSAPPWQFASGLDLPLWIRMLYSCLVDADFLDTESYMEQDKSASRGSYCSIEELIDRLDSFYNQLERESENTSLNRIRTGIRKKCTEMAQEPQGVFSLSVPTGGGKTLSGLAFALHHAKKHGLDRVIYVVSYTSIIEQNADVFRNALGREQVIEHHSSLDEEDSTPKSRLATENWDAPIIVTTSVQFFESLFAAKSSRCRKLHNIANSIVILDEAQLVPVEYLSPILETMQLLVEHYHVSFVISTATQPAFGERVAGGKVFKGLKQIREIIGDCDTTIELYNLLKRVNIELPSNLQVASSWEKIAESLRRYDQVLCIVSDRKSCRELHAIMPEGTFHLSALMCGQHRSEVIAHIKEKLAHKEPVRVISTQLVEAGVDLDFPVVYRALAGLDSIVQAAGRCNREGKLAGYGKVVIFVAPRKAPMGILRKAAETTVNIMASIKQQDLIGYDVFHRYFSELYWKANSLDSKGIISLLAPDRQDCGIYFRTAAGKFRIVDDSQQKSILVRYGEGDHLIDLLKQAGPNRSLMRKLQRYVVNVYDRDFNLMLQRGSIEEVQPKMYALTSDIEYSSVTGLMVEETFFEPHQLII